MEEFDVEEEWLPFEIHPETPRTGMKLSDRFPGASIDRMFDNLSKMGKIYGIEFNKNNVLSNSFMSLTAGEYAKEKGKFHEFHERIFNAYFTEKKDIGNMEVVMDIAESCGLNRDELRQTLEKGTYDNTIRDTQDKAHAYGINSAPTFIIDDKVAIVGAQPLEAFKEALLEIEKKS
jgi:predicted DsbA family dithiol-disulfide isomerase